LRARQPAIYGLSGMRAEPGGTAEILQKRAVGFPSAAVGERWRDSGCPGGAFRIRFRTPGGHMDSTTGQAPWLQ
jgi:hypothetical protein